MNDPWITTYSGRQFFLTHATADDIYIEDIAHALSNVCRYVGQCRVFYSVAEHSVRMAELMISRYIPELALPTLLHDSPEAYLNDVNTNLKWRLPAYREIEAYLLGVILGKYMRPQYYTPQSMRMIKALDSMIRTPEVLSLFPAHDGWVFDDLEYEHVKPWSHKKAEKKFLKMFRKLYEEVHSGDSLPRS